MFSQLSPRNDYEKWLYVFSDFLHNVPNNELSEEAKSTRAFGEWNIILISDVLSAPTTRTRQEYEQTIRQIEDAIPNKSKYHKIQISDLHHHLPEINPTNGWEKLETYQTKGFIESNKDCLGITAKTP